MKHTFGFFKNSKQFSRFYSPINSMTHLIKMNNYIQQIRVQVLKDHNLNINMLSSNQVSTNKDDSSCTNSSSGDTQTIESIKNLMKLGVSSSIITNLYLFTLNTQWRSLTTQQTLGIVMTRSPRSQ